MEMNTAKVNRSLEACKKYLDEAENEIKNLESDIASEMKRFKMKTAAITSGIGAIVMLGGGTLTNFWAIHKKIVGGPN